jgi:hypothetical protein
MADPRSDQSIIFSVEAAARASASDSVIDAEPAPGPGMSLTVVEESVDDALDAGLGSIVTAQLDTDDPIGFRRRTESRRALPPPPEGSTGALHPGSVTPPVLAECDRNRGLLTDACDERSTALAEEDEGCSEDEPQKERELPLRRSP